MGFYSRQCEGQLWACCLYLAVQVPGLHGVSPFADLLLDCGELTLQELPHQVQVAAIQPVVVDGDGVLLKGER